MDPITAILLGLQTGSAIYKGLTGVRQQRQAKRGLAELGEAPISKPAEYANLVREARAGDLVQRQIDEINRSIGTGASALQRGGSRAVLGGSQALVDAGTRAKTTALAQQQKNVLSALERDTIGGERAAGRALDRFTNRERMFQAAALAGAENIAGAFSDVSRGAAAGLEAFAENPELFRGNIDTTTPDQPAFLPQLSLPQTAEQLGLQEEEEVVDDIFLTDAQRARRQAELMNRFDSTDIPAAGRTAFMRSGAKVFKTKGKFSHEENPIDVVQDGVKVAELTGGEYVFNPNQSKQMLELSKSGNSKLHKFVRNLLSQERFK